MLYSELSKIYEELESTTKRLEKTHIIANLLKKAKTDDLKDITLLVQGRVFPTYDQREIGVASRLILKALSESTGTNSKKIEDRWAKVGDLGKVAEELVSKTSQRTLFKEELTTEKVIKNLRKIAELEGTGTVNKKMQLIRELLASAKPLEARYIIRTIISDLRIGAAEGVIRDAITWAFFPPIAGIFFKCDECSSWMPKASKCLKCGEELKTKFKEEIKKHAKGLSIKKPEDIDKKDLSEHKVIITENEKTARDAYNHLIEIVQEAINLSNDYGVTAFTAKTKGIKGLKAIELKIGVPIKVMLYQKAKDMQDAFETVGKPAALEYKYDGFRCITGYTPLYIKDKGFIAVRDIKKNDSVLTHKGNFKKIIALNKRKIDPGERLFEVKTFYGNSFKISEKHPLLVLKGKPRWINIEDITKKDKIVFPIPKLNGSVPFKDELVLKDCSGYTKTVKADDFFFRFLGYWIGDGFTNEHHNTERVGLVFNAKEKELADFYEQNIKKTFKIEKISRNIHNGAAYLYWRDKPLRIWLSRLFRREWKGKMIPSWFSGINKEQFRMFLKGWIESDGHTDKLGRTSITTKEKDLAMFASLLGLKFGIMIGVKRIRVGNRSYQKLILPKSSKGFKFRKTDVLVDIHSIKEIKKRDPKTSLYNLQVESDESYCTSMASLHNCQIHKDNKSIKLFTRRLEEVTHQFPDIVKVVKENIKSKDLIIEGEVIGIDPKTKKWLPFQNISQRIKRKYDIKDIVKNVPVMLNLFDAIMINKKNLINEPFEKRRKELDKIVKQVKDKIQTAKQLITSDEAEAGKFYEEALEKGNEGIMVKNLQGIYKPGSRVGYGVKVKPTMETLDLVVTGAEWGTGKRAKWLSSLTIACKKGDSIVDIGKVGTGIKEKESEGDVTFDKITKILKPLIKTEKGREVTVKPKLVLEIDYEEIQASPTYSSGFALRFPRVIKIREDKPVDEVDSLDKVKALYSQQRGR